MIRIRGKVVLWAAILAVSTLLNGCQNKAEKSAETNQSAVETEERATEQEEATEGAADSQTETEETKGEKGEAKEERRYNKKPDPVASEGSKILFVGNSHTYVNNLPGMFLELAFAGGHNVDVYDLTEGMYYLEMFADPEDELGAILYQALTEEKWDFVFLQDNTNAAFSKAEEKMFPYARILNEKIKNAGGQTGFFMTWSPEDGTGIFGAETVQKALSQSYQTIARELDSLLLPGGDLFMEALSQDSELQLWGEDGQHPSETGTYLTACAVYALLFQETPEGNQYIDVLDQETAGRLQKIAADYMLGESL
ncbi:MAG: hypothetical protein Q4C69_07865 [Lachnoclostridium edouardi]|uniref:DUF4886 domain-containing protein n=1 Tax=Lachnoclostridium edouardi TaxID=1926283 RepID=UPI0026DC0B6A|nr:DUF4886 domain-containing protein [Lachnoclostridium edouardi]MDO4278731.1 hypothetical protein [Lachnoclostridium edouardi]